MKERVYYPVKDIFINDIRVNNPINLAVSSDFSITGCFGCCIDYVHDHKVCDKCDEYCEEIEDHADDCDYVSFYYGGSPYRKAWQ